MPKPDLKAAAARVAEVARKTGGVFVFATQDANLTRAENASAEIAEYPFAEHTCSNCDTVFSAVKAEGLQSHCITCGSHKTTAGAETKPNLTTDDDLAHLTCASCATTNVFPAAMGKEVAAAMRCTACGDHLHVAAEGIDEVEETLDIDDMEMLDLDDEEAEDEDVEVAEKTGTDTPDNKAELMPGEAGPSSGKPPEDTKVDTPVTDANQTAPSEPNAAEDGPQVPASVQTSMKMDMADTIGADDKLQFAFFGKQVAMLAGMKIVATLDPADAGDHGSIMQTQAFVEAVAHMVNSQGLKPAIAHYGFKTVKVDVPVKAMVDKAVAAAVAGDKAKVTAALNETAAQFQHATDIAAAGFANNFWRNKADPVKSALIQELSALGISSAQKLVDRVFAAHGVAQLREVITLARELSDKPTEALNALAQAVDLAKYLPAQVKAADEDEDDDSDAEEAEDDEDTEESTITTIATPVEVEDDSDFVTAGVRHQFKDKTLASLIGDQPLF